MTPLETFLAEVKDCREKGTGSFLGVHDNGRPYLDCTYAQLCYHLNNFVYQTKMEKMLEECVVTLTMISDHYETSADTKSQEANISLKQLNKLAEEK